MPNFAVLSGNRVMNIIVSDSKEIAESITNSKCIEYDIDSNQAIIGQFWDGTNFVSSIPEEPIVE